MKFLYRYLRPSYAAIAIIMLFVLIRAMAELSLPRIMSIIVDQGIANGDIPFILRLGLIMLGINLIGMLSSFVSSYLSAKVAVKTGTKMRGDLFEKITGFSMADMDRFGASSLITRVSNDIMQVQNVMLMSLRIMLRAPLLMVGGIFMAVTQDARLSSILWITMPVLAVSILLFVLKGMPLFKAIQSKIDVINRITRENLSGLRVIRAFNRRKYEQERFHRANRDLADTQLSVGRLMALLMPYISLILNLGIVLVLWFGSKRVSLQDMQVGSLMAFIQYVGQIMFALVMVSMIILRIPQASVSLKRLEEVMMLEPGISCSLNPAPFPENNELSFDKVSFRYHGAESPVLCEISFDCRPGDFIAIIGGTGSGKTSLLKMILRFYDPESGIISIGGIDIKNLSLAQLRKSIAYIPQKSFLFSGTVDENIRYGNEDIDKKDILKALETAQIKDFIISSQKGLETESSKGGTNFSGGQRQRIAIARALVRKPDIYLLDDCFSSLDAWTERNLRNQLIEYTRNSIVLMVTQRVSSAMAANRIIVLDEGRISGIGTHEELAKTNRVYQEILGSQLDGEEEYGKG